MTYWESIGCQRVNIMSKEKPLRVAWWIPSTFQTHECMSNSQITAPPSSLSRSSVELRVMFNGLNVKRQRPRIELRPFVASSKIIFALNRPLQSCLEPHYECEAECKVFHVRISFVCIWMKTNFVIKTTNEASLSKWGSNNSKMAYSDFDC